MDKELCTHLIDGFISFGKMQMTLLNKDQILRGSEQMVLFFLKHEGPSLVTDLGYLRQKLQIAPSTLTPIITNLETRGLVVREVNKDDRRNIKLKLTKKGLQYVNDTYNKFVGYIDGLVNYLGRDKALELLELLTIVKDYLKEVKHEDNF